MSDKQDLSYVPGDDPIRKMAKDKIDFLEKQISSRDEEIANLKYEFIPYLEMLIADWNFRNDESGIEQPDSPEMVGAKELLGRLKGE